jgi:hypothetical protein
MIPSIKHPSQPAGVCDWETKSATVPKYQKPGFHSSEAGFFIGMKFRFLP